jgi:hypothetical protein
MDELGEEQTSIVTLKPGQKLLCIDFWGKNTEKVIISSLLQKF